jgi:hypothetical protein
MCGSQQWNITIRGGTVPLPRLRGRILLVVVLASCSVFGDDSQSLAGLWGGTQVEVTASHSSLVINWYCFQVTFPGPIALVHADSFAVSGKVTAATWTPEVGQPWRVSGVIVGDTLSLTYSWVQVGSVDTWEGPWTIKLPSGHGTFEGLPCPE